MKDKIKFFYGIDLSEINTLLVKDKEAERDGKEPGNIQVESKDLFWEIPLALLEKIRFDETKSKHLKKVCDSILFEPAKRKLILIEIKTNISFDTYRKKTIYQFQASYFKMCAACALFAEIRTWDLELWLVGNMATSIEEETMGSKESDINSNEKVYFSYQKLQKHRIAQINLPVYPFFRDKILPLYHQNKVNIRHILPQTSINLD